MTIDDIRGSGALGLVGEAKLLPDPANGPIRAKAAAVVPGLGKVDLQAGALETFMKLKGIELEAGMSGEQIKALLTDGLAMAVEVGKAKADLLQQQLDQAATSIAKKYLGELGDKLGPWPFDARRSALLLTQTGWDTISADSPLAKSLEAGFARAALRKRVIDLINSVLGPFKLVASLGAGTISVDGGKIDGRLKAAPEILVAAFLEGHLLSDARRTAVANAAMFAAGEIVAQVTTKLKIATDNGLELSKAGNPNQNDQRSALQLHADLAPVFNEEREIAFEVAPQHAPDSVAKDWAWATKNAPSELWQAIEQQVTLSFLRGLGDSKPRYRLVSVRPGKVTVEPPNMLAEPARLRTEARGTVRF